MRSAEASRLPPLAPTFTLVVAGDGAMFGFPLVPEGQVVVVQVGSPVEEVVASDGSVVQCASSRVAGDLCRPPRDGWRRVGALPQRHA